MALVAKPSPSPDFSSPQVVWRHEMLADGVRFEYDSPEGEGGYPGALSVKVTARCVVEKE